MTVKASFSDRLGCPDCGAPAERLGHYRTTYQAGVEVLEFIDEPIMLTRTRFGERFRPGATGVISMVVGTREVTLRGTVTTQDIERDVLPVTHLCTNPDCSCVFPAAYARRNVDPPASARLGDGT